MSSSEADGGARAAQVFVLVAVVAMMLGVSLVLLAREPYVVDLEAGQSEEVFRFAAPSSDPLAHSIAGRVPGPANLTVNFTVVGDTHYDEPADTYEGYDVSDWTTEDGAPARSFEAHPDPAAGRVWSTHLEAVAGETWTVSVHNVGNDTARFEVSVTSDLRTYAGYALVGVGILGFVSYRLGMRRSGD